MKEQVKEVRTQVLETIAALMTTAFGLIAALAWNETIKAVILQYFQAGNGITGLLIYAVIVTIIAVISTIIIARAIAKPSVQEVRIVK